MTVPDHNQTIDLTSSIRSTYEVGGMPTREAADVSPDAKSLLTLDEIQEHPPVIAITYININQNPLISVAIRAVVLIFIMASHPLPSSSSRIHDGNIRSGIHII